MAALVEAEVEAAGWEFLAAPGPVPNHFLPNSFPCLLVGGSRCGEDPMIAQDINNKATRPVPRRANDVPYCHA